MLVMKQLNDLERIMVIDMLEYILLNLALKILPLMLRTKIIILMH